MTKIRDLFVSLYYWFNPKINTEKDESFVILEGNKHLSLNNYGKWIIIDDMDKILEYVKILRPYIENKTISQLKYSHKEGHDSFPEYKPTLMVYCEIEEKEYIKGFLESLQIKPKKFIEQKETQELWKKGGKLSQESDRQQTLEFLRLLIETIEKVSKRESKRSWITFVKKLESTFDRLDLPDQIRSEIMPIALNISKLYDSNENWEVIKLLILRNISNLIKIFEIKYVKVNQFS